MKSFAKKILAAMVAMAILIPMAVTSFAAPAVERIDLNIDAITIGVGQKVKTVKPEAYPEGSANVFTWESSDENIATVNAKGQIKGVKKGSATITISADGVSAELEVNVVKKGKGVTKISLPKTASVVRGKSTTLKATLTPAKPKNKTIIWKSSDESVATVDSKGKVTGVSTGKATITAISSSGKTTKTTVTVKPVKVKKIKVEGKASMLRNETQQLNVTIKPAGADNQELKWTSSNKKVATVDANGVVTAKKKGTVTITATAKDGSKVKGTFKITVKKGVFTPTPAPTAEPTAEPTVAPTTAPIDERIGTKYVAKTYTSNGVTQDASLLGSEFSIVFNANMTADFTLAGLTITSLPWTHGTVEVDGTIADTYILDYYGTMFTFVHTNAGFNLDYYGTLTLHYVPENAPAYPPAN